MDLRINKVYNLVKAQDVPIYDEAHNFYLQNSLSKEQIEQLVMSVTRQSVPIRDILDALFLIGVLPNSRKTFFLGYLFYAIPLPPFWYMTFDIGRNRVFYNYKVVCKNLELPPFYQYLEYLMHYYDDVEDEIEVEISFDTIEEEYLTFYQYKENEYSINPLVKYRRLAFDFLKNKVNKTTTFKVGKIREKDFESANNEVDSYITKNRIRNYKNQKDIQMINEKIQNLIQRNKRVSSAITSFNKTQGQLFEIKVNARKMTAKPVLEMFDELEEEVKEDIKKKRLEAKDAKSKPQFPKNNYLTESSGILKTVGDYDLFNQMPSKEAIKSRTSGLLVNCRPPVNKDKLNIGIEVSIHVKKNSFVEPVLTVADDQDKKRLRPITAFQISKPKDKMKSAMERPVTNNMPNSQPPVRRVDNNKENIQQNNEKPVAVVKKSVLARPASEFVLKKNVKSKYGTQLVRCKSVLEMEKNKVGELHQFFSSNKILLGEAKLRKALTIPDMFDDTKQIKQLPRAGGGLLKFVEPKRTKKRKRKAI